MAVNFYFIAFFLTQLLLTTRTENVLLYEWLCGHGDDRGIEPVMLNV
jgi:hypothetical protein